ncbi:MAG: redoxin domain-containing protein [Myxococcota bacterium]
MSQPHPRALWILTSNLLVRGAILGGVLSLGCLGMGHGAATERAAVRSSVPTAAPASARAPDADVPVAPDAERPAEPHDAADPPRCHSADPRIGSRAVSFRLPALGGGEVTFPTGRQRISIIAFWARWCQPCFAELPMYRDMVERLGDSVELVLVSTDEDEEDARAALEQMGLDPRSAYRGEATLHAYRHRGLPYTVVTDRHGTVRIVHRGFERTCLPALERAIRQLM